MLTKLKELEKKKQWGILAIIVVLVAGGFYAYKNVAVDADTTEDEPAMQTAKVRTGDLILYANGSGLVVPAAEASFGFRASGQVVALSVKAGDTVMAGDLLAELDNTAEQIKLQQAERTLADLISLASVATAQQALAQAELDLKDAKEHLAYLISWAVLRSEEDLEAAQAALAEAKEAGDTDAITAAETELEKAEKILAGNWDYYENHYAPENYKVAATRTNPAYIALPTEFDILKGRAAYAFAQANLTEAKNYLRAIQEGEIPEGATGGNIVAFEKAQLDLLAAQDALAATRLYAPISGSVLSVDVNFGDTVSTSPIITIASTDDLLIKLYMDETDVDKALVGNKTNIVFDAFPDVTLSGEIVAVEKALQSVDSTPVIVSLVDFDPAGLPVLSGMSADVEIIGGEALGALLVPIQALREVAPGSYGVFVVENDEPKLTPVEVGLRDFANAEILSGLEAGDVISTGIVETQDE